MLHDETCQSTQWHYHRFFFFNLQQCGKSVCANPASRWRLRLHILLYVMRQSEKCSKMGGWANTKSCKIHLPKSLRHSISLLTDCSYFSKVMQSVKLAISPLIFTKKKTQKTFDAKCNSSHFGNDNLSIQIIAFLLLWNLKLAWNQGRV